MTINWNRSQVDGPVQIPILGAADLETGEQPVVGYEAGCHLNVGRSALPSAAEPYEVTPSPNTPTRVAAGDYLDESGRYVLTALLRFDDEAQAADVMPELVGPPIEDDEP